MRVGVADLIVVAVQGATSRRRCASCGAAIVEGAASIALQEAGQHGV